MAYKKSSSDDFDAIDVRGTAKTTMTWFQKYFKDVSKESVGKQAAVGGVSGWVVGYLSMKVGKAVATVIGGSLIVMQIAAHQGYIKIDWSRVNSDFERKAKALKKQVESRVDPGYVEKKSLARRLDKQLEKTYRHLEDVELVTDSWIENRRRAARRMYRKYILGDSSIITVEDLYALNVYLISFSSCALLGRAMGRII